MAGGEELGGYDTGEEMKGISKLKCEGSKESLLVLKTWSEMPNREAVLRFRQGLSLSTIRFNLWQSRDDCTAPGVGIRLT